MTCLQIQYFKATLNVVKGAQEDGVNSTLLWRIGSGGILGDSLNVAAEWNGAVGFEINLATSNDGSRTVRSTDPSLRGEGVQPLHSIGSSMNNHQLWPHAVGCTVIHCSVPLFDCPNCPLYDWHVCLSWDNVDFNLFVLQVWLDAIKLLVGMELSDIESGVVVLDEGCHTGCT